MLGKSGVGSDNSDENNTSCNKIIHPTIEAENVRRLKNCWVGKVKNIGFLRNIQQLLKEDGLGICKIQYVGGLHILCEWSSVEAAEKCLSVHKTSLDHWFSEVRIWDESLVFHERLAIEGLPVEAWSDTSF